MMRFAVYTFSFIYLCWYPTPCGNGQDAVHKSYIQQKKEVLDTTLNFVKHDSLITEIKILQSENDSLRKIKNVLYKEQVKYLELLADKPPKIVIVPVYVDTVTAVDMFPSAYLSPPHSIAPPPQIKKKRDFWYRLFHKKERNKKKK